MRKCKIDCLNELLSRICISPRNMKIIYNNFFDNFSRYANQAKLSSTIITLHYNTFTEVPAERIMI